MVHVHKLRVLPRTVGNTSLHSYKGSYQETMAKQELKVWNSQVILVLSHGMDGAAAPSSFELLLPLVCDILSPAERPVGVWYLLLLVTTGAGTSASDFLWVEHALPLPQWSGVAWLLPGQLSGTLSRHTYVIPTRK